MPRISPIMEKEIHAKLYCANGSMDISVSMHPIEIPAVFNPVYKDGIKVNAIVLAYTARLPPK